LLELFDAIKDLLEAGADVNVIDGENDHPLQTVSFRGNEAVVCLLLETGVDVNIKREHYDNTLQASAYNGNNFVVRLLLNAGADINSIEG